MPFLSVRMVQDGAIYEESRAHQALLYLNLKQVETRKGLFLLFFSKKGDYFFPAHTSDFSILVKIHWFSLLNN